MLNVLKQFVKQKARDRVFNSVVPAPHVAFPGPQVGTAPPARQAPLPQQLAELQRRSCDVLAHHLLKHPAAEGLRGLGNVLLARTLKIQAHWRGMKSSGGMNDQTAAELNRHLRTAHRILDIIVSQLTLCSSTARDAEAAAECGRRIIARDYVKFHTLLPLVDRVCDDVRRAPALSSFTPIAGLSLTAVVESQSTGAGAATFVAGLTTARVLAWAFRDDLQLAERLAQLLLAALFQDLGKLSLADAVVAGSVPRARDSDWLVRQHPAIGAALLGLVRGSPVELPLLVAQHHEQLDGRGFPRSLTAAEILPDAQVLAVAARFADLCLEQPSDNVAGSRLDFAKTRAVQSLVSESEWGHWRQDVAREFAERVAAEREGDAPLPILVHERPALAAAVTTADGDRHRQLHDQEPPLQGTHTEPALPVRSDLSRRANLIR